MNQIKPVLNNKDPIKLVFSNRGINYTLTFFENTPYKMRHTSSLEVLPFFEVATTIVDDKPYIFKYYFDITDECIGPKNEGCSITFNVLDSNGFINTYKGYKPFHTRLFTYNLPANKCYKGGEQNEPIKLFFY